MFNRLIKIERKTEMIFAFLAGAAVFGAGILTGMVVTQTSFDKVLSGGTTDD